MAEFCEVMKQAHRMCNNHPGNCVGCMLKKSSGCLLQVAVCEEIPASFDLDELSEIERVVMDWAAKHPELRYPSWREWHKANFPEALHNICPNFFMRKKPLGTCAVACAKCMSTPIPADIAEKLHIAPIGGTNNG